MRVASDPSSVPLVLVVDDARDMRDIYSLYLRYVGFRAETANGVDEAIQKAVALRPAVVVMDLFMPGASGAEGVLRFRTDPRTEDIRIIGLSAATLQAMQGSFAGHCDRLLTKPCTPEELVDEIQYVLETCATHAPTAR